LVSKKLIVPAGQTFKTAFIVIGSLFLVSIFALDFWVKFLLLAQSFPA